MRVSRFDSTIICDLANETRLADSVDRITDVRVRCVSARYRTRRASSYRPRESFRKRFEFDVRSTSHYSFPRSFVTDTIISRDDLTALPPPVQRMICVYAEMYLKAVNVEITPSVNKHLADNTLRSRYYLDAPFTFTVW